MLLGQFAGVSLETARFKPPSLDPRSLATSDPSLTYAQRVPGGGTAMRLTLYGSEEVGARITCFKALSSMFVSLAAFNAATDSLLSPVDEFEGQ